MSPALGRDRRCSSKLVVPAIPAINIEVDGTDDLSTAAVCFTDSEVHTRVANRIRRIHAVSAQNVVRGVNSTLTIIPKKMGKTNMLVGDKEAVEVIMEKFDALSGAMKSRKYMVKVRPQKIGSR